eukprot:m.43047 g.43047  ORF g.43047 m.43047 type:complete len:77 (+) comp9944_c0_seq2:1000-1230(+)
MIGSADVSDTTTDARAFSIKTTSPALMLFLQKSPRPLFSNFWTYKSPAGVSAIALVLDYVTIVIIINYKLNYKDSL